MNTTRPVITGRKGVIASGHYLATSAGLKMFAKGGNAIDAAIATGFALTVLKQHQSSLGGECPILIYSPATRKVTAISGQGAAPRKATIKWFRENGIDVIPGDGYLGATVPGVFGAYCAALLNFGRLTLREILEPAIDLAQNGFPMYRALRDMIVKHRYKIAGWPHTAGLVLPGGEAPAIGSIFRQPELAKTLLDISKVEEDHRYEGREKAIERAVEYFYKGEIACKIVDFVKNNPVKDGSGRYHTALLEPEDFACYHTRFEEPISADYRNYTVFKCNSWTQGPVFLQQLKLLEGFELGKMKHNSAEYIHTVIECAKLAFADRERYYGDPDFSHIPMDMLLSDEYARERRKKINPGRANNESLWEESVPERDNEVFAGDTTHLDIIDDEGYMISATPSGGWFHASPIIPGVGFALGTRAQMFNLKEGHPNCLQPCKRPRTTLTPSMAFKDGKPWMAFGTPGGDNQDQWTLQFLLNVIEFGMDLQQAVDVPTFHTTHFEGSFYPHNRGDGTVFTEPGIEVEELRKLQNLGHRIHLLPPHNNGEVCGVCINHETGTIEGAASIKEEGNAYAMGW